MATFEGSLPGRAISIAVVGAGVIGLSVGINLIEELERFGVVVTIISDEFTPNTVSDKAGAALIPFDVRAVGKDSNESGNDNYADRMKNWTRDTFKHLQSLYHSEVAGKINIQYVHGYFGNQEATVEPWWGKEIMIGFRRVGEEEKRYKHIPLSIRNVFAFNTFIISGLDYLPWLMDRFKEKGGLIEKRKVNNLSELISYDIIVNCTGLGGAELVNDTSMYPVRGDTVIIRAPWVKEFFLLTNDEEDYVMYIFPRSDDVLLGGSKIMNEWSMEPNDEATDKIIKNCSHVLPNIASADVLGQSVGLRPTRAKIRLEVDSHNPSLIHCYGHGGQGLVVHWGCALEVVELVKGNPAFKTTSKL